MDKAEEKSFETYPIENGIDNYPISRAGFIAGYHQAERELIDKVCEWLKSQYKESYHEALVEDLLKHFRKAMEE